MMSTFGLSYITRKGQHITRLCNIDNWVQAGSRLYILSGQYMFDCRDSPSFSIHRQSFTVFLLHRLIQNSG